MWGGGGHDLRLVGINIDLWTKHVKTRTLLQISTTYPTGFWLSTTPHPTPPQKQNKRVRHCLASTHEYFPSTSWNHPSDTLRTANFTSTILDAFAPCIAVAHSVLRRQGDLPMKSSPSPKTRRLAVSYPSRSHLSVTKKLSLTHVTLRTPNRHRCSPENGKRQTTIKCRPRFGQLVLVSLGFPKKLAEGSFRV